MDPNDPCIHRFGDLELNRSHSNPDERYSKVYTPIKELTEALKDQEVYIQARLHASKPKGKLCFFTLREQFSTVQAGLFIESSSKGMIEFARRIPKESIIEVKAKVVVPEGEIKSTSQKVELHIIELWVVNRSAPILPFQLEDASRRVENQAEEDEEHKGHEAHKEEAHKEEEHKEGHK